jgi:hypothetical protein
MAHEIVPKGSTCLPVALKDKAAPRLEVGAVTGELIVCAIDAQEDRLLGPVGCWKVDVKASPPALSYTAPMPIPGRGFSVRLDDRCARGYCLPKDAKATGSVAHVAWSIDGSKVAVLVGEDVHLFDAASKAHEKTFSIRGDKGVSNDPTAVHWVGDAIYVEGTDAGPFAGVWVFKPDGTAVGPIQPIGGTTPASTYGGSFSVLDKNRVAVAEQGFSTVTIYESDTGKRTKLVRKLVKPPCKPAELEAWWNDTGEVAAKCKEHMEKSFGPLIGAPAIAGGKSFVIALRDTRVGELGLYDLKTLAEKPALKLPWCAGEPAGGGGSKDAKADAEDAADEKADAGPKTKTRGAVKKEEDPDAGGE